MKQLPGNDPNSRSRENETLVNGYFDDGLAQNIFTRTENDNKPGMSFEDRKFVEIMEKNLDQNGAGNWTARRGIQETEIYKKIVGPEAADQTTLLCIYEEPV